MKKAMSYKIKRNICLVGGDGGQMVGVAYLKDKNGKYIYLARLLLFVYCIELNYDAQERCGRQQEEDYYQSTFTLCSKIMLLISI